MERMTPNGFNPNLGFVHCRRCNKPGDYLSNFQICDSCCKQMEKMIPSGFKPNLKFVYCRRCYKLSDHLVNNFQICDSCCKQMEQMTPIGFNPNLEFVYCRRCNEPDDYLNNFQICGLCCKQMEKMTPIGFNPNLEFVYCRRCNNQSDYLNEFDECERCGKCKRCKNQKRDYLNDFEICDSCYKRMEQMTPNGFNPNLGFVYCRRCNEPGDYLNNFQICDSCCKRMEQMTPIGFKPNLKLEKCKRCYQKRDYLNNFLYCNLCYNQMSIFKKSGNEVMDNFIRHALGSIEFVSFDKFKNIKFVAEGGFSKVYRATWIDCPKCYGSSDILTVALKELNNSKNITSKGLNELQIYFNLKYNNYINKHYGITQDPTTQNFMIIMDYYELGNLTYYISSNFFNTSWLHKLYKLYHMISGLENLHKQDIIHKDYHSGNIFVAKSYAVTGDLGISRSAIDDNDEEIYGIIPYVSPEIFQGQKYTKASDIYSFGMVMWELMTGRRPFWDQNHDTDLIIKLYDGIRPPVVTNAPKGYIELMQKCWCSDPKKRPTAFELKSKIITLRDNEYVNPTKIIKSSDIGPVKFDNPNAIYKSRPLSAMIKSAEYTRSLKQQRITLKFEDKRKFDDDLIGCDNDNDKIVKKVKQDGNDNGTIDYTTKELGFDI